MAKTLDAATFAQKPNTIGGSRIKVAVRIRPLLDSELNQGHSSTCLGVDEGTHRVR